MLNFKVLTVACCVIGLALGLSHYVFSEKEPDLIPRALLFGNPVKTSPKISPDGTKLAYIAPDKDNVLNVWVRDLDNPSQDRMVTSDHKSGIRGFLWQFDNTHILYSQDKDGDENTHLYQTNIQTKQTRDLTPFEGAKASANDYDYKFPNEILVEINHRDKSEFDIYRINLETGEALLEVENHHGAIGWLADHNLQTRAMQAFDKEGNSIIYVRDTMHSPWTELLKHSPEEEGSVVSFTKDNQALYIISNLDSNTKRLIEVPLSPNEKTRVLVEDPQYDISSISINPITYELEGVGVEKDRFNWMIIDSSFQPDFDVLNATGYGLPRIISSSLSNRKWVVAFVSDQRPAHYYLYDRDTQKLEFLFSSQPDLDAYQMSPMTPISFKARDGMVLHGYLTLPEGKTPKNLPTVLFVHGGPWVRDTWGFSPVVQWFANRGYAVLQVNYRGSSGYGKNYINAGDRQWGGKMHTDLLDAKAWIVDNGYADPEKVAIYGGSYGGYATLVGLTFTPDEFCCGVDIVGPSNVITLRKTMPPYWAVFNTQMDKRVGRLDDEEFLNSISPLNKVEAIVKPLLIGQGANDPRVKQSESDQIVKAMRSKNIPVEYLLFEDEGHGFQKPANRLKFFAASEEFLAKYLGGRYEPATAEDSWESLKK